MFKIPSYFTTIDPWCFSIYIAPREIIREALPEAVSKFRSVTYLYHNPGMRIFTPDPQSDIQCIQVISYDELFDTIIDSNSSLLLIEYSYEWFIDYPEMIHEFGKLCRAYTWNKGTIVLMSVKMNYSIRTLQSLIKSIKWVMAGPNYLSDHEQSDDNPKKPDREYEQQVLF